MVKAIIELSNYILVLNLLLYTIISFVLLPKEDEERSSFLLVLQDVFIFINHLTGSLVLLSTRHDMTYLFYPVFQMIAIFSFFVLMRAIYPKSNRLLLNHIGLLLSVSFVILTRLSFSRSVKQFAIVAVSMIIALIIPSKAGGEIPRPLSKDEIMRIVKKYGEAAKRAQIAGFDTVEIHLYILWMPHYQFPLQSMTLV